MDIEQEQEIPLSSVEPEQEIGTLPQWIAGFPFLGELPKLTAQQWLVLELITLLAMLGNYSMILRQYALPQIRADLGIAETEISGLIALAEWGALPALLLMVVADKIGRRKLMILSAFGIALTTGATAFAITPQSPFNSWP